MRLSNSARGGAFFFHSIGDGAPEAAAAADSPAVVPVAAERASGAAAAAADASAGGTKDALGGRPRRPRSQATAPVTSSVDGRFRSIAMMV